MAMYPYEDATRTMLRLKGLSEAAIHDYHDVLTRFFQFQSEHNDAFSETYDVSVIAENDVRHFLDFLKHTLKYKTSTIKKWLAYINIYFRFLFTQRLNNNYPTVNIQGPKFSPEEQEFNYNFQWLQELPFLLENEELHYYTRMTLLLLSHGYTAQEMLSDGFYKVLSHLKLEKYEKKFLKKYIVFITPIQHFQENSNLFLMLRLKNHDPRLSYRNLLRYLKMDSTKLDWEIYPRLLHQSYLIHFIQTHPDFSDMELMTYLRIDPSSLDYYKRLA